MWQLGDDGNVENSTQRFLNLTVRGFRRLAEVDLALRPLIVLIGANGVGKSSLLDALSILASSAHPELLSLLAGLLREATGRTQIVVATH
ncbi:MAG: AAA family ATPase [Bryobacteraceae bacterium]